MGPLSSPTVNTLTALSLHFQTLLYVFSSLSPVSLFVSAVMSACFRISVGLFFTQDTVVTVLK